MRLRQVELHGFKSFRAKTGIEVGDGITAVVGPNGCGKSNIVDAIRWAMGTQSARSLRGSEMLDVVFAGSRTRKPAGFAEVSLTFENEATREVSAGDLARSPVRAMADGSSTLTVTRRLHRSGDSEYLINGIKVRLKDVQELFLGTGASVRGYSIIEQGQIEFLVNSRPAERRAFVEELAGVTRYRYHRQETEKKLGSTQGNLERLEDLLGEVKRRMGQLKRQAHQAERHAVMAARKRRLEIGLLLAAHAREEARLEEVGDGLLEARERHVTEARELTAAEAVESTLDAALRECEGAHRQLTEEVYRLRTKRELLEQSVQHAAQSRERLIGEQSRLDSDEAELHGELEELATRVLDRDAEIAAKRAAAPQPDESLREAADAATVALARAEAELEGIEGRLRLDGQQLAHEQALIQSRRDESARLEARRTGASELRATLVAGLAEREARLLALGTSENEATSACALAAQAVGLAEDATAEARQGLEVARHAVAENRREHASRTARREAMTESAFAEAGEGARKVLDAAGRGELRGLLGLVGDGILTPPDLEGAVHGVLRDLLEYVVVVDEAAARAVIAFAESERVVVGCIEQRALARSAEPDGASLLGQLEVADWVPDAVRQVLGGAVAVDSLLALPQLPAFGSLVDRHGHCANAAGFWRSADPGGGVVARRARLLHDLAELDRSLAELARAYRGLLEAQALAEARLDEQVRAEQTCRAALEAARRQAGELAAQRQRLEAEIEAAHEQLAEHERRALSDAERAGELDEALRGAEAQRGRLETTLHALEAERDGARERRDAYREERDRRQQAWAAAQAAQRQHEAELQRLLDARHQLDGAAERTGQRLEKVAVRRREIAEQMAKAALEMEANAATAGEVARQLEGAEGQLARASGRLDELQARHLQHLAALKSLRSRCAGLRAELDRLALCEDQARRELERSAEGLGQHFGLSVAEAREELGDGELPEDARVEVAGLARDLEALGPINHAALEELREAERRHDFLCQQQADLVAAIDDMRLTIDELDHASRTEFLQTFVALREEFENLFTRLFRGGEATLELTDADDPLEAGVEVTVRPPGKNVCSMTLLSGGEKALTAVALVFAAFRLKPSPFCVLDEVDAPLDDQNVERFVALIDELSDETQFLVITHNRRTMEGAHKLVGVTMEEPGASKLLAVNVPNPRPVESSQVNERAAS